MRAIWAFGCSPCDSAGGLVLDALEGPAGPSSRHAARCMRCTVVHDATNGVRAGCAACKARGGADGRLGLRSLCGACQRAARSRVGAKLGPTAWDAALRPCAAPAFAGPGAALLESAPKFDDFNRPVGARTPPRTNPAPHRAPCALPHAVRHSFTPLHLTPRAPYPLPPAPCRLGSACCPWAAAYGRHRRRWVREAQGMLPAGKESCSKH